MQQSTTDALSPEKLHMFIAGLAGVAPGEVKKAKVLYLRNAVAEYRAMVATLEAFAKLQGCMAVVPVFWPILWAQRRSMQAQRQLANERIDNAIDVWRDELKGERFNLGDREILA